MWGNITQNTSADVDAIISGHTHLAYNCSFPVQDWVDEDRAVTERPVVSSGQYGQNLNQLVFTVDAATGEVAAKTQSILALTEASFPEDPAVVPIVDDAIDFAAPIGAQVLGEIEARSTGPSWPTAPRRTVVASPPWATWSPRCSAGDAAGAGWRADRVHEPGWSAGRHGRHR